MKIQLAKTLANYSQYILALNNNNKYNCYYEIYIYMFSYQKHEKFIVNRTNS